MLPGFSCRDLVAVLVKDTEDGAERRLVVCSAYLPYDSQDPPHSKELVELEQNCENDNLYLVIECDSNAHHTAGGSTDCNDRGEALVEFLNPSNLEILSQCNEPAFCSGYRLEVTDITLGAFGLLESITSWEVSSESSLLDHRHILFTLQGSIPVCPIRNPTVTNWGSNEEGLRDRLERGPEMNMKDEAGLGFAIQWVQQALISAYEGNCPLRPVQTCRQSLNWTLELESLRK
jgi:ferredoxin